MGRVIIVGGGFAGLAAACRLAAGGHRPLLLERSRRLGGRGGSFRDPATGETIDDGHHVLMRCCTATTGFLQRIGAESAVSFQASLKVPIVHGEGRTVLRSALLPGALHLAPALLSYRLLTRSQRGSALRAGLALAVTGKKRQEDTTFATWLSRHRQEQTTMDRLWDPVCIATLNASASDVSLAAARKVFIDGFLRPGGADLGLFTAPLAAITEAAAHSIASHRGEVRTATGVRSIRITGGEIHGVELTDGTTIRADAVIAAVPPWDLEKMIPSDAGLDGILTGAAKLHWSPIINVHLWFDGPVIDDLFFIAVDAPIQAVFDVSRLHRSGWTSSGKDDPTVTPDDVPHVVISQSAAKDWVERTNDEIVKLAVAALGDVAPRTCTARLIRSIVIRRPRATFLPVPGSSRLRPPAPTPVRGLYLAGDWTATGWPSTIEGAVRSGIGAAARVEAAP